MKLFPAILIFQPADGLLVYEGHLILLPAPRSYRILNHINDITGAKIWRSLHWKNINGMNTFYPILIAKHPTVRLRRARRRDLPNIIRMLRKSFSSSEPLVDALQMTRGRYSPALEEYWQRLLTQGMTFLAVPSRIGNNTILGAVINTTVCPWDASLLVNFSSCILCPKTRDLINLWAHFLTDSNLFDVFNQNRVFNIAHVVIDEKQSKRYHPDLTARSLGSHLINKSIKFAYNSGFDLAFLVCTGDSLAAVAEGVGMDLFWKERYSKLLNERLEPLFKSWKRNAEVKVFIQELKGPTDDKKSEIIKSYT